MPLNFNSLLSATDINNINRAVAVRFSDPHKFRTSDAVIAFEQHMLPEETLFELCNECYEETLINLKPQFISKEIISLFEGFDCVPLKYDIASNTITVGVLPEISTPILVDNFNIEKVFIPIYSYVQIYTKYYGEPSFLGIIPPLDKFDFIINEAIALGAADITLAQHSTEVSVYYNVRKRKVYSKRSITSKDLEQIVQYIGVQSGVGEMSRSSAIPIYPSLTLNKHYRGRICITRNFFGFVVTIRLLSNDIVIKTLEDLNIDKETCSFIREYMLSDEAGLRLFIGPPMSGKNTSIIVALQEVTTADNKKIVSIESPVETIVPGIEQIPVNTDEEFAENTRSLLRQNPDLCFIAEISEHTALQTTNLANVGLPVFSTIHANSIADVIYRLCDLTKLSPERIILTMHSCVFQELKRVANEDKIIPVTRFLYFSKEIKDKLMGKSLTEIKNILEEAEKRC